MTPTALWHSIVDLVSTAQAEPLPSCVVAHVSAPTDDGTGTVTAITLAIIAVTTAVSVVAYLAQPKCPHCGSRALMKLGPGAEECLTCAWVGAMIH